MEDDPCFPERAAKKAADNTLDDAFVQEFSQVTNNPDRMPSIGRYSQKKMLYVLFTRIELYKCLLDNAPTTQKSQHYEEILSNLEASYDRIEKLPVE